MADEGRVNIPSGMGGLVRYFEDYKSKIEINPEYVVYAIIFVIIAEVLLQIFY